MTVFKTYLKMFVSMKIPIILYLAIFAIISFGIAGDIKKGGNEKDTYREKTYDIAVLDSANTKESKDVIDYFKKEHRVSLVENREKTVEDVYNLIYDVLIIIRKITVTDSLQKKRFLKLSPVIPMWKGL